MGTAAPMLPLLTGQWVTTRYMARQYNRSEQYIRRLCMNGSLIEFGFRLYQSPSGEWWIGISDQT